LAVTSFAVVRQDSPTGDPLSVTVRLALTCGGRPFALTASSAVRRFQTY